MVRNVGFDSTSRERLEQFCAPVSDRGRAVVVLSGGMDSTTLLYLLKARGYDPIGVSFDYGQRHRTELGYAAYTCGNTGAGFAPVDLSSLRLLLHGSALTDSSVEVPHGHYAEESMKKTVVPNRNMIMLSIAAGIAVAEKAVLVATGVHAGDHAIYPDCRPEFIMHTFAAIRSGNEGFISPDFQVQAPFINMTKTDIARIGQHLGVPWEFTWSCYEGGSKHCGRCGTCVERIEAFRDAGIQDPTQYQPPVSAT
jgi:7-cyano-7-deazaguanine synthase